MSTKRKTNSTDPRRRKRAHPLAGYDGLRVQACCIVEVAVMPDAEDGQRRISIGHQPGCDALSDPQKKAQAAIAVANVIYAGRPDDAIGLIDEDGDVRLIDASAAGGWR